MEGKAGRPRRNIHPGAVLGEELKDRRVTIRDFAHCIGVDPLALDAVIRGMRDIDGDLAARLERRLGIPAKVWLNMQEGYLRNLAAGGRGRGA